MECNDIHHVLGTNAMKFLKHQRKTKKPLKTLLPRRIVCQEKDKTFSTPLKKKKELERVDSQSESWNVHSLRSFTFQVKEFYVHFVHIKTEKCVNTPLFFSFKRKIET